LRARLNHFVSKSALDISGFGEAIVNQFVETKQFINPWDIYKLTENMANGLKSIISLEGLASLSAKNLMDAIVDSKTKSLWQWIHALGIPNIGIVESQSLAKAFNGLQDLWNVGQCEYALRSIADIGETKEKSTKKFINENIDLPEQLEYWNIKPINEYVSLSYGFDFFKWMKKFDNAGLVETTLERIIQAFPSPENLWTVVSNSNDFEIRCQELKIDSPSIEILTDFCNNNPKLPEYLKLIRFVKTSRQDDNLVQSSLPLSGQVVVVTGTLPNLSREEAHSLLKKLGATVTGSVSRNTTVLLAGEKAGNKLIKANELGIPVHDETWLKGVEAGLVERKLVSAKTQDSASDVPHKSLHASIL
jgi:DNA ligase (NAD+)